MRTLAIAGMLAVGCGGDGASLRLAPVGVGPCGRPGDARALLVTPLGDFAAERQSIALGQPVALSGVPAETRAFAVEVVGAGGEVAAIGRTSPFDLATFADGDTIGVAMGTPDGVCPAGALTMARDRAHVVRVGDGVLVVGGTASASAERYDPATETTTMVPLPAAFTGALGLVGSGLVALPDGRAVIIGGVRPGYTIYTPGVGFGPATLVTEARAHHVALAIDADHVLLAAGCGVVDAAGACEGANVRRDTRIVDLATGSIVAGPPLAIARRDGVGVIETDAAGRRFALLAGGLDERGLPVTSAERIALDGGAAVELPGAGAALAVLDSGATVTGFAPAGAAASATAAVLVPGLSAPRPTAPPSPRVAPVLVAQDDGLVIALGGGGAPLRYRPADNDWQRLPDLDATIAGEPAALRWDDGSVLVFGGRDGADQPTAAVWRFRPRLLGPWSGAITVVPGDTGSDPPLAPLDPAAVDRTGGWRLGGATPSWAIVGGPTAGRARIDLTATVPAAGLAIILSFVGPADRDEIVVVPGAAITLERVRDGVTTTACRGPVAPAAGPLTITVELTATTVRAAVGGGAVLSCPLDDRARGRIGVASRGEPIAIGSISIAR